MTTPYSYEPYAASAPVLRFLSDLDYQALAVAFDRLRQTAGPNEIRALDRWQADAALHAEEWDAAWSFRRIGLLRPGRRITIDDVATVLARCRDLRLRVDDVHLITLGDTGLTPWGEKHRHRVDAVLGRYLGDLFDLSGSNPVLQLAERFGSTDPSDEDLEEFADGADYRVTRESLRRQVDGSRRIVEMWHGEGDRVAQSMYEYLTEPRIFLFQPTQGLFLERPEADWPQWRFKAAPPWLAWALVPFCQALLRRCENEARQSHGLPAIGSGWIGETELYRQIAEAFPEATVMRHGRPRWLRPQHLDVYLPEANVGVEYQGTQHSEPVEYFGGEEAFAAQVKRDRRKRRLCRRNGCALIEVHPGYDIEVVLAQIEVLMTPSIGA